MINDKQRREAARGIRQFLSVSPNKRAWDNDGLQTVGRLIGTSVGENILVRLADLIEPQERTCKIEGTYDDEYGIYDHLTCGHVAMRQWPEPTRYCPSCGAEVVE